MGCRGSAQTATRSLLLRLYNPDSRLTIFLTPRPNRRSRSLGCSAAAYARVCMRVDGNSRHVAACSVGWRGAGAATGSGGVAGHLFPTIFDAHTRRLLTQKPDFMPRRTRAEARGSQDKQQTGARCAETTARTAACRPVATNARARRDAGRAQGPKDRADTRLPGTEPERQRISTRGAHLASAPERRGLSTPRRGLDCGTGVERFVLFR